MKRRLFLTGPIGCGKSTAIAKALGDKITQCGGFFTRRYRQPHLHFTLESPDGLLGQTFLDFANGKPVLSLDVFGNLGVALLMPQGIAAQYVMDEIGGIELLNPDFFAALDELLNRDVPILGVLKGEGAAGALIESLGLAEEYTIAAARLRNRLESDADTLVYQCGQYDERALLLARQWVEEYFHDEN